MKPDVTNTKIEKQSLDSTESLMKALEIEKSKVNDFITPFKENTIQKIQNCQEDVSKIEQSIDEKINNSISVSLEKFRTQISNLKE